MGKEDAQVQSSVPFISNSNGNQSCQSVKIYQILCRHVDTDASLTFESDDCIAIQNFQLVILFLFFLDLLEYDLSIYIQEMALLC